MSVINVSEDILFNTYSTSYNKDLHIQYCVHLSKFTSNVVVYCDINFCRHTG